MVKLSLTIILFLISLLTLLPAPAFYLWLLAIAADEFSWIFIAILLVIILLSFDPSVYRTPTLTVAFISLFIFASPMARAYVLSKNIHNQIASAFGDYNVADQKPFSYPGIFKGNIAIPYKTVSYKKTDHGTLTMDFYPSAIPGVKPCVLVVHGGSWKSGNSKELPELNSVLASKGYHIAAINYRLAPSYQNPAPVEDVRDALAFLKKNAAAWHIDSSQFILMGRSAGAQIALLAGFTLKDPEIKGIIDFYGPADMVWGYSIPSNPLIMDSRKIMEDYLGGDYASQPQKFDDSSPLLYVSNQSPPTLLIHGKNDVLVAYEHSRRLDAKLKEKGVKHYLLTLPWATHAFDYNLNGPGGQLSTYAVMYFLKSVTN